MNKRLLHATAAVAACAVFAGFPAKTAAAEAVKTSVKSGKESGTMICAYHSGNCNGFPFASMRERRGYLEPFENDEYAGTYTIQVFLGDEVVFCHEINMED